MKTIVMGSLLAIVLMGTRSFGQDASEDSNRLPDLPAACGKIAVAEGNKLAFHAYAVGVQVYRWNGSGWDFVEPVANLYADANYRGKVGSHFAGPTWESDSGSQVRGAKEQEYPGESGNIPWLLLGKVSSKGPGIFKSVSFIQRVNTVGGVKPADMGSYAGEPRRVPYTAEYYFYRPEGTPEF
jgi:hypothetical protein